LLDTHILVWLATRPEKLSDAARELLARPSNRAFVSSISFWELRIKWNVSRKPADDLLDPMEAIPFAERHGFELATLSPADCVVSLDPRLDNRDPFDEQLLIHASQLGAKLLTRDRKLIGHPHALGLA
jgi:PIN domain nuclease of toxin-antitoxin system